MNLNFNFFINFILIDYYIKAFVLIVYLINSFFTLFKIRILACRVCS